MIVGSLPAIRFCMQQTSVQDNMPETILQTIVMNTLTPLLNALLTTAVCSSQLAHAFSQSAASDASLPMADVMAQGLPDSASLVHNHDSVDSIFEAYSKLNFRYQEELYNSLFLCYFDEFHITLSNGATLLAQLLTQHNMILAFDQLTGDWCLFIATPFWVPSLGLNSIALLVPYLNILLSFWPTLMPFTLILLRWYILQHLGELFTVPLTRCFCSNAAAMLPGVDLPCWMMWHYQLFLSITFQRPNMFHLYTFSWLSWWIPNCIPTQLLLWTSQPSCLPFL